MKSKNFLKPMKKIRNGWSRINNELVFSTQLNITKAWTLLICLATDDQGRLLNDPENICKCIKKKTSSKFLEEIKYFIFLWINARLIISYEKDGKNLLQVIGWWDIHKNANMKAEVRPSLFPPPSNWCDRCQYFDEDQNMIKTNW